MHARYSFVVVRLTRQLAEALDGYGLRAYSVGDVVDLPDGFAMIVLAEGWAEPVQGEPRDMCDDRPPRRRRSSTSTSPEQ